MGAVTAQSKPTHGDEDAVVVEPQTRAEATGYLETSHYEDVIAFLEEIEPRDSLSLQYIGESPEGRPIPLVIAARPLPTDAAEARRSGKPIVCIQANIHAGEVEGKEAALMLLRDLTQEEPAKEASTQADPTLDILDQVILLVLPIYNIDGNEQFGPQSRNRSHQMGPESVGVRSNGQGLDLNRDYVKLDALETQAAVREIFNVWRPDVFVDLHATNGTLHGYHLTYAPPLHPDTDPQIAAYARDELLAETRQEMRGRHGMETFDYGDTPRWSFADEPYAWYGAGAGGRYGVNYMGLRNCVAILSEAMSHRPFDERVEATYHFVSLILEKVADDADRLTRITRGADERMRNLASSNVEIPQLSVRFERASRGLDIVLIDRMETPELRDRKPADRPPGPPEDLVELEVEVYDRFQTVRTRRLPSAYLLGPELEVIDADATIQGSAGIMGRTIIKGGVGIKRIVSLLRTHGIAVETTTEPWSGQVDQFIIESREQRDEPYQGHNLITLEGHYETQDMELPVGSFVVRTDQPLSALIFHILEPESLDGVAAWDLLDASLEPGEPYPIVKQY